MTLTRNNPRNNPRIQLWRARGVPAYLVCMIDEETGTYLTDDKHSLLVQTDWDFPGLAESFGWSLRSVQWPIEDSDHCDHDSTDGTIACPDCGMPVSRFIGAAQEYLDDNNGKIVEDAGYFAEVDNA